MRKNSISEIQRMSAEDAEHRCFERLIECALEDNRPDVALVYMKKELVLTQNGGSL